MIVKMYQIISEILPALDVYGLQLLGEPSCAFYQSLST